MRNSELILYFFYKNMVFTLPQFYFAFYCGFSAQTYYDDFYISFYNLFFTSLPLFLKALFDCDINYVIDGKQYKEFYPKLYFVGQKSTIFNFKNYLKLVAAGFFHSICVFFIPYFAFMQTGIMHKDGKNGDLWTFSVCSFSSLMIVSVFNSIDCEREVVQLLSLFHHSKRGSSDHSLSGSVHFIHLDFRYTILQQHDGYNVGDLHFVTVLFDDSGDDNVLLDDRLDDTRVHVQL